MFKGLDAALDAATTAPDDRCGWGPGTCARWEPARGTKDFYEPDEPTLARAGLPWFCFVADSSRLTPGAAEEYARDARGYWSEGED